MKLVISDSGPLHYLILVGRAEVLPSLYQEIIIPSAVQRELLHRRTPDRVRGWMESPPGWLKIATPKSLIHLPTALDSGEHAALSLAVELRADLVLLDEADGRKAAAGLNLSCIGTLGILVAAAQRKVLRRDDTLNAIHALRQTNMRITAQLLEDALAVIRNFPAD